MESFHSHIPVFCIYIPTNFISTFYMSKVKPSWEDYGFNVTLFPAVDLSNEVYLDLKSKFISKKRPYNNIGKAKWRVSEISRFLSHVLLWREIKLKRNISEAFIIEHDCKLTRNFPESFTDKEVNFFTQSSTPNFITNYQLLSLKPCSGYFLKKSFAIKLLEYFSYRNVEVDIDEFLFNVALEEEVINLPSFYSNDNVFAREEFDPIVGNTVFKEKPDYNL